MKKNNKIRVEFHVHTNYSYDCSTSLPDLLEVCRTKKIDMVAICDHNQIEGALRLQTMSPSRVIVGEEILTRQGEIIGLFLKKFISPGMTMVETISEIKRQGGLVYLPHPFDTTTRKTAIHKQFLAEVIKDIDIIETSNGRTIKPWDNRESEKYCHQMKKIACVGSDAHTKYEIGRNYIVMDKFNGPNGFLKSLSRAYLHKSVVMPWVFLLTKYHRFMKRIFINDEQSTSVCNICDNNKAKIIYEKRGVAREQYFITDNSYGDHSRIVKCSDCNLTYCSLTDNNKKLVGRYTNFEDPNYEKERIARKMTHERVFKKIKDLHSNPGKLLDIGCATGTLLEATENHGWKGFGIEPSTWASKIGREKYKLDIFQGTLETAKFRDKHFDAVTCLDVIEHISSPKKLLAGIHRILKKDGVLCIVTPDIGSFISRILGENWWHIRPDHIYYFTKESLSLLLLSQGFRIEKMSRYSWTFSLGYWISRLQNKLPFVYKLLAFFKDKQFLTINFHDSLEVYARKV